MNDDLDPKETEEEAGLEDFNPEAVKDEENLDELGVHVEDEEEDPLEEELEEGL